MIGCLRAGKQPVIAFYFEFETVSLPQKDNRTTREGMVTRTKHKGLDNCDPKIICDILRPQNVVTHHKLFRRYALVKIIIELRTEVKVKFEVTQICYMTLVDPLAASPHKKWDSYPK